MDLAYLILIAITIALILVIVGIIINFSDHLTSIFIIGISITLASLFCIELFWLNGYSKKKSIPLTSQIQTVEGREVHSINIASFDDGSYIKKDNEYSSDYKEQYNIRIFLDSQNGFTEKTISGEITYYYTTNEPHIEQYLEKEQHFLSDAKYSYKIYIPKIEESTETTQSTTNTETTTDNTVENN